MRETWRLCSSCNYNHQYIALHYTPVHYTQLHYTTTTTTTITTTATTTTITATAATTTTTKQKQQQQQQQQQLLQLQLQLQQNLHYIPLHYAILIALHDATVHSTTQHYTNYNYSYSYNYKYTTLCYATLHYTRLHDTTLHNIARHSLHYHKYNCNYTTLITLHHNYNAIIPQLQLQLHYTTLPLAAASEVTTATIAANSNHLSVHQWIHSAMRDSQQPNSPLGFLLLKLPPPPCVVLYYWYITSYCMTLHCIAFIALEHTTVHYIALDDIKWHYITYIIRTHVGI